MKNTFNFKVLKADKKTKARVGEIHTPHGIIKTPCFVAVGTQATVKTLSPDDLRDVGVNLLFGNTYHLHLRPGEDTVKDFGGLSKFMSWNGPTITDSGGFQVFSLGQKKVVIFGDDDKTEVDIVNIKEDGVVFRSHLDGSKHIFTPEISIEIQKKLGADIILCFDECAPHPSTHEYTKAAMNRTHEWALRCLAAFRQKSEYQNPKSEIISNDQNTNDKNRNVLNFENSNLEFASNFDIRASNFSYYPWQQALYGIIQGGIYKDLRIDSAKFISSLDFDGIAIGGVSVGESKKEMRDVLDWVTPFLLNEKPRHLLGIGEVDDIFDAVYYGMDTFDCVIPTRFGRYGIVFAYPPVGSVKNRFRYDLTKTINAKDKGPVVDNCNCHVCKNYTRGYLHHLFKANEMLAYRLASYHNMHFLVNLTKNIRNSILEGKFDKLREEWLE